jgi:hypothetical protein
MLLYSSEIIMAIEEFCKVAVYREDNIIKSKNVNICEPTVYLDSLAQFGSIYVICLSRLSIMFYVPWQLLVSIFCLLYCSDTIHVIFEQNTPISQLPLTQHKKDTHHVESITSFCGTE